MQCQRPIAFFSQGLKGRFLSMSTYEKELVALVSAVKKWRPYLLGHPFKIKTDHQSLKFILEQKIGTPMQQRWVSKLLGYDFIVEYKKGQDNKVADALSCRDEDEFLEVSLSVISYPTLDWLSDLKNSYTLDSQLLTLLQQVQNGTSTDNRYSIKNDLLLYKQRLYVSQPFRKSIMQYVHASPIAGHAGYDKTIHRARRDFFWPGMKADLRAFVRECDVCQRVKAENVSPAGLLQPLPVPERPWYSISMDFIEGLPLSKGHSVIWVIVDRLTKYAHFLSLAHPYTATSLAQLFVQQVFKLHGLPNSIISDRDTAFTSKFWTELFRIQGVFLAFSTAYHPQSDGQSEAVNKCVENYLRCMVHDKPSEWTQWLPLAEYCYNTSFHHSSKVTPFQAMYGYLPPRLLSYLPGTTKLAVLEDQLKTRDELLRILKQNLQLSQNRMKKYADLKRTDRNFEVGTWVYLRLQPYRQMSVAFRRSLKISPRFYGPFLILQKIGKVAYRLDLPPGSLVHPVFHVSQLKEKLGVSAVPIPTLPPVDRFGVFRPEPEEVLDRRSRKYHNRAVVDLLIRWHGQTAAEATWEPFNRLKADFPHLVGKVF